MERGNGPGRASQLVNKNVTCNGHSVEQSSPYAWTDADGTQHIFPIIIGGCNNILSADAFALDGSGLHMFVATSGQITVYSNDGQIVYGNNAIALGTFKRTAKEI